jgi:steroid delta-isomerase-like uncharacterized protein
MNIQITAQQLAAKYKEAFRSSDPAALAALYTEDGVYHEGSQVTQGREAIAESYAASLQPFSGVTVEFWNVLTCGEYYVYQGTWRGTHTGPFATPQGDVPPTRRKVEFSFVFINKMNSEGLIQEDHTYYDSVYVMQQLGLGLRRSDRTSDGKTESLADVKQGGTAK